MAASQHLGYLDYKNKHYTCSSRAPVSFDTSAHQAVGILALLELLSVPRAIPFYRPWRQLRELDALHMKPLAMGALDLELAIAANEGWTPSHTISSSSQQIISP